MKAAIYARVSSEEQTQRQSIETQRDFAARYCELHEILVAGVYSDDGVSGTIALGDRPEGRRLLDDARAGVFDTVYVYRLDRLGRDPLLILTATRQLESLGIQLKSMTEPFDRGDSAGRLMHTMLSGFAGYERDTIIERSVAGTNRLARAGAWLGGITPFGYRVEGKHKDARLVVSEEQLPGDPYSEAGVIRLIYRMAGDEKRSCKAIADHLNRLGIPPSYARDGRAVERGKRREATAGIWYPGRVRNLLVNATYKGLHQYGKRSKRPREVIERPVPAIVDPATWDGAQATLRRNRILSDRNARRQYLLRGLMKCGLCGMTYCGNAHYASKVYYICSGRHAGRGPLARDGGRCPSKAVPADLEDVVWRDVEGFLRDPGPVLEEVGEKLAGLSGETDTLRKEAAVLEKSLRAKDRERDAVLGLFRRERIDEATLDQQLDEIEAERAGTGEALQGLQERIQGTETAAAQLRSAEALLCALNARLDAPLTFELKRELVETLVEGIRVDTLIEGRHRDLQVTVAYRFAAPADSPPSPSSAAATEPPGVHCAYLPGPSLVPVTAAQTQRPVPDPTGQAVAGRPAAAPGAPIATPRTNGG